MATPQVPEVGFIGEQLNLLLRQGATFRLDFEMRSPDGSLSPSPDDPPVPESAWPPVDLTGCTIRGQIRKRAADAVPTVALTCAITAATQGRYRVSLTAAQTAAIGAGTDRFRPDSTYVWDLELEDALGAVLPLYWGEVRVHREVTRA